MEANNLSVTGLKTMVVMMLRKLHEDFNREMASIKKDTETIKRDQAETKITIKEMKGSPD